MFPSPIVVLSLDNYCYFTQLAIKKIRLRTGNGYTAEVYEDGHGQKTGPVIYNVWSAARAAVPPNCQWLKVAVLFFTIHIFSKVF